MKKSFAGLSTIIANLQGMQEEQNRIIKRMAQRLAQIFLREVKRRTPVGSKPEFDTVAVKSENGRKRKFLTATAANAAEYWRGYQGGTLRRAWVIRGIRKTNGIWTATIFNPMEYASYVENGHRQQPGALCAGSW